MREVCIQASKLLKGSVFRQGLGSRNGLAASKGMDA